MSGEFRGPRRMTTELISVKPLSTRTDSGCSRHRDTGIPMSAPWRVAASLWNTKISKGMGENIMMMLEKNDYILRYIELLVITSLDAGKGWLYYMIMWLTNYEYVYMYIYIYIYTYIYTRIYISIVYTAISHHPHTFCWVKSWHDLTSTDF